ncbi:MAG TPA: hypothetical protein VFP12_06825 [Allosphingosinicella sp.]|nr:hypothetical protein [Allosphingosinicella sp.]
MAGQTKQQAVAALERAVNSAARKLHAEKALRRGVIAFRTGNEENDRFMLKADASGAAIDRGPAAGQPLIEVMGDPARISAILSGRREARKLFLLGGIRVRGDMAYLSELGMKLGILDEPLV